MRYSGDVVHVLLIRGSIRAEVLDSSKVLFKKADDLGVRVYEAGSISPTVPRDTTQPIVIVYPRVEAPRGSKPGPPARPQVPPK